MENKCCCIINYPSHYRDSIFSLMDKHLECDFYFGDRVPGDKIKELDCNSLSGFKGRFRNYIFHDKIIWQKGVLKILSKDYTHFILSLDKICISELLFLKIAFRKNKKTYLWTHGWYGNESKFMTLYKKLIFRYVSGFFLYGEYARGLMINLGFHKENLYVIGNSSGYYEKLRFRNSVSSHIVQDHFKNNLPTIVFSGRLTPQKKLDQLIECCRILNNNQTGKINCLIIGDGQMRKILEQKVQDYDLTDSVWFYGSCYDVEMLSLLIGGCDICVSPGNVGLTAIDSLSFGTPVISHDDFPFQMPEFEAIIPGKTGDFFKRNDIYNMASVINKWLLENPVKSKECISACYDVIDRKYNPNNQIQIIKDALNQSHHQ